MNEIIKNIQIAINTVQDLEIKSTASNMTKLLGVVQLLSGVRDKLKQDEKAVE
jgi:hypothetical protein